MKSELQIRFVFSKSEKNLNRIVSNKYIANWRLFLEFLEWKDFLLKDALGNLNKKPDTVGDTYSASGWPQERLSDSYNRLLQ